eukprot:TRINITY_DN8967_c0_g1_i11.p1 TRINITY_DN8967_c0_g1~~TRINITY_DN8967_c0_g1_i11.p1  ORF type:complete len:668 (-),score=66.09 TRINITY_DN8967_c0_g1_i11:1338-3341(-)
MMQETQVVQLADNIKHVLEHKTIEDQGIYESLRNALAVSEELLEERQKSQTLNSLNTSLQQEKFELKKEVTDLESLLQGQPPSLWMQRELNYKRDRRDYELRIREMQQQLSQLRRRVLDLSSQDYIRQVEDRADLLQAQNEIILNDNQKLQKSIEDIINRSNFLLRRSETINHPKVKDQIQKFERQRSQGLKLLSQISGFVGIQENVSSSENTFSSRISESDESRAEQNLEELVGLLDVNSQDRSVQSSCNVNPTDQSTQIISVNFQIYSDNQVIGKEAAGSQTHSLNSINDMEILKTVVNHIQTQTTQQPSHNHHDQSHDFANTQTYDSNQSSFQVLPHQQQNNNSSHMFDSDQGRIHIPHIVHQSNNNSNGNDSNTSNEFHINNIDLYNSQTAQTQTFQEQISHDCQSQSCQPLLNESLQEQFYVQKDRCQGSSIEDDSQQTQPHMDNIDNGQSSQYTNSQKEFDTMHAKDCEYVYQEDEDRQREGSSEYDSKQQVDHELLEVLRERNREYEEKFQLQEERLQRLQHTAVELDVQRMAAESALEVALNQIHHLQDKRMLSPRGRSKKSLQATVQQQFQFSQQQHQRLHQHIENLQNDSSQLPLSTGSSLDLDALQLSEKQTLVEELARVKTQLAGALGELDGYKTRLKGQRKPGDRNIIRSLIRK